MNSNGEKEVFWPITILVWVFLWGLEFVVERFEDDPSFWPWAYAIIALFVFANVARWTWNGRDSKGETK